MAGRFTSRSYSVEMPVEAPQKTKATLNQQTGRDELVVLTHGIFATKWVLVPLARRLRKAGFETRLRGYPTLRGSIQEKGDQFAEYLATLAEANAGKTIHVVAHSMGSILTRCALQAGLPQSVGRVVMIGPPNRGSHVARRLTPYYGWLAPTLAELSDEQHSFVNRLPRSVGDDCEVGIIAAGFDRVVRPGATELDDHADHITLNYMHTSILWREQTAQQVASFLRSGRFHSAENATA